MTKTEIFEFLELPDSASEKDISSRLADKYVYFTRLQQSAPNEFLRKLHVQNVEKVKTIQQQYGFTQKNEESPQRTSSDQQKNKAAQSPPSFIGNSAVAWLIKHTETKSSKSYPVYKGENFIGRIGQPGKQMILIDDDPYMSRAHALLYADDIGKGYDFYVVDSALANGGKASKNGTYINADDNRIANKTKISPNDTIQVGTTKLILRLNNDNVKKIIHEVEETEYMKTVVINIF